ncbi:MAG: AAA family ATPase, partial [Bacteroidales bacterium]
PESYGAYYVLEQGVTKRDLLFELCHVDEESDMKEKDTDLEDKGVKDDASSISKYATNLSELAKTSEDPLVGREDILQRTLQVLCRREKNNPIHIGEPGVGKTAITMGLAKLINEGKVPKALQGGEIFALDLGAMLAGTQYRGDFENRIKKVLDSLKKHEKPIVYIDEIHNIVGAGALGGGSLDASNLLKPYLTEGKVRFIGATTFEEYKKYFEKDKSLVRRFQTIEVKEPTVEETIKI